MKAIRSELLKLLAAAVMGNGLCIQKLDVTISFRFWKEFNRSVMNESGQRENNQCLPVQVGIVSTGRWSRQLAEAVSGSQLIQLRGACGRDSERTKAFVNGHGGKVYSSYDAMLADDAIEAIILPTPHFLHYPQAVAALEADKHVFVEKPIANSVDEAERMRSLSKERELVLCVGLQLRRTAAARRIKRIIDSGAIGEIATAQAILGAPLMVKYSKGDWQLDPARIPGGALDNLAIHYIDLLCYWLGPVESVHGFIHDSLGNERVLAAAAASIKFRSGVVATLSTHQVSIYISEARIFGSRCMVEYKQAGQEFTCHAMEPSSGDGVLVERIQYEAQSTRTSALMAELDDFASCIRGGGSPEVEAEEGIYALQVVRAIMEASESGRKVDL